jgi:hypothetical protein
VVWSSPSQEAITGIQFVTNMGRVSPHYGGSSGTPTVLYSDDGALVAFSGRLTMHTQCKEYMISQLQVSPSLQMLRYIANLIVITRPSGATISCRLDSSVTQSTLGAVGEYRLMTNLSSGPQLQHA